MSEPRSEDDGVLREWAPLSGLLREIPLTVRRGLFLENVTLTCVNAIQEYLAVGTNIGVVYWYHRESHSVQRLRPEKCGLPITCVKIASSVDYMVAAGDKGGTVTVFRIPKPTPDWLPPSYKHNTNTNVERYTVGGLHMGPVSALEWSMNGQKLFSGDTLGIVVYTEIDFYMNLSKAYEILNEKYCIVQLSFNHHCQTLLVATEYRCILAYQQESWKVVQVGQKERRSLCHVGATFSPQASRPLEPLVYSGRAGLRFWQADKEGTVHKTIIFKDAVKNPHPTIRLLRPRPVCTPVCDGDMGLLLPWRGNLLVTHSSCTLLVLDPQQISVVASLSGLTNLHSIAVTQNEIFIIEGARNIARFAYTPDVFHVNTGSESIANMPMSLLDMSVAPVAGTLMDLTNKLKETASKLVTNNPGHTINGIQDNVSAASEATELDLPPVVPLTDSSVEELTVKVDPRIEVLDQIGKQSFDDILYNSERKQGSRRSRRQSSRSKNHNNNSSVTEVSPSTESNSDTVSVASIHSNTSTDFAVEDVTPMQQTNNNNNNNNNVNNNNNDNNNPSSDNLQPDLHLNLHENSETTHEIPFDIQPDLRSPGTILKELHDKEILVAKALNLEEVLLADDNSKKQDNVCVAEISNNIDSRDKEEKENKPNQEDCEENSLDCDTESSDKEQSSDVRFGDPREHISDLSYGPPSGSSSAQLSLEVSTHPLAQEYSHLEEEKDDSITHYNGGWRKIPCPETALYIEVCSDYVCVSGPGLSIHCSRLENGSMHWQKLKYRAVLLALSPSAQVVWKLDFRVAHALTDPDRIGPYGSVWEVAARNVESVALDDTVAWYISDGKIYLQAGLSKSEPFKKPQPIASPSPTTKVSKICCSQHVLWILTSDGEVFRRVGITDDCVEGNSWLRVNIPNGKKIGSIALGPKNTGWIVNRNNCIFFSDNYTEETPEWWQVLINNYVFEKTSLCQITANHNSVWVTNKVASFVQMNNTDIKGHQWLPVSLKTTSPSIKWKQVTAEGVFEDKGSIWLLSTSADLYHMCPSMNLCELVSLPCHGEDIRSLAAAPHALWLLTQYGHIYIRQGINDSCPKGNKWRQLNLEQINKKVTLCHVSCGCDVVWACDTKGDVYMVVGSPYTIATDTFSPAWVPVEDNPLPNTMFTKVFVGSETHMVWALDNKNNVYVREGIFPDFQLGTGWFPVPGLSATSLSISGSAVWALSPDGSIYRRCCISQNNYVGNYWIQVPGSLSVLTASVSNDLWGITGLQGSLQVYSQKTVYLNKDAELKMYSSLKDDDWEVI